MIECDWNLHEFIKEDESRRETGEVIVGKTASNLIDEIKKLSRQDQAAIVVEVLDTQIEEGEEFTEQDLLLDLQRREAEGMDGSVSWTDLRDMA